MLTLGTISWANYATGLVIKALLPTYSIVQWVMHVYKANIKFIRIINEYCMNPLKAVFNLGGKLLKLIQPALDKINDWGQTLLDGIKELLEDISLGFVGDWIIGGIEWAVDTIVNEITDVALYKAIIPVYNKIVQIVYRTVYIPIKKFAVGLKTNWLSFKALLPSLKLTAFCGTLPDAVAPDVEETNDENGPVPDVNPKPDTEEADEMKNSTGSCPSDAEHPCDQKVVNQIKNEGNKGSKLKEPLSPVGADVCKDFPEIYTSCPGGVALAEDEPVLAESFNSMWHIKVGNGHFVSVSTIGVNARKRTYSFNFNTFDGGLKAFAGVKDTVFRRYPWVRNYLSYSWGSWYFWYLARMAHFEPELRSWESRGQFMSAPAAQYELQSHLRDAGKLVELAGKYPENEGDHDAFFKKNRLDRSDALADALNEHYSISYDDVYLYDVGEGLV